MKHRKEDDPTMVITRAARPAWQLVLFVATIIGGLLGIVRVDHYLAVAAAREITDPVDKKLSGHLTETAVMRVQMEKYVDEERSARRSMNRKLDALCRANPKANCPLGED